MHQEAAGPLLRGVGELWHLLAVDLESFEDLEPWHHGTERPESFGAAGPWHLRAADRWRFGAGELRGLRTTALQHRGAGELRHQRAAGPSGTFVCSSKSDSRTKIGRCCGDSPQAGTPWRRNRNTTGPPPDHPRRRKTVFVAQNVGRSAAVLRETPLIFLPRSRPPGFVYHARGDRVFLDVSLVVLMPLLRSWGVLCGRFWLKSR